MKELLEGPLRRTADGYEIQVRFDWYRALPLSCFGVEVRVDGQPISAERMHFCVNDRDYTLQELAELHDEFWFVLDPARLRVVAAQRLEDGPHEVEVDLSLRIPYLFDEETGDVLTLYNQPRASLEVE